MVERREFLQAALGALAGNFARPSAAQDPAGKQAPPPKRTPFSRDTIVDVARKRAKEPYRPPPSDLREPFASMTYDQYVGIKLKPGAAIWGGDKKGFSIEPLHRSPMFSTQVEIYLVEDGVLNQEKLSYDQSQFDYGGLKITEKLPDMGFSGFRVLRAQNENALAEIALFQGWSFFRATAPEQVYGIRARGLSVRTADPRGEELPNFIAFYIERPALGDNALVVHALLESPSVTGAYSFTLRPSEATILDTELTLFPRVELDHIGIASLAGASLFTPLDRRRVDDVRPAAADMAGLQILSGTGEWLWRPLSNRADLQLSSFMDKNLKGFGFLQRSRDISSFEDIDHHWERRPSLWIEPHSDWGEGSVQLVEIPSESAEINQNVVAYWRPKQPLPVGKETTYAYRQFWCWDPPARPPLAYVTESRGGRGATPKIRRFLVVFGGEALAEPARLALADADVSAGPGSLLNKRVYKDAQNKTCRVVFDLDPGGESYSELRLVLKAGDEIISETWLYRWTL